LEQQTLEMRAEELAEGIRNLDNQAPREFILEFYPRIENYFRKRGLPDDAAAAQAFSCAEKVVREVVAGKYKFQRQGGFIAWVFRIAELEAIGWHRRNKPAVHYEDFEIALSNNKKFAVMPESEIALLAADERRQIVQEAVARLSPDDQTIIRLRFLEFKLSYEEIAQHLGIQNGAARTRCSRALDKLKLILEADPRIAPILPRSAKRQNQEVAR